MIDQVDNLSGYRGRRVAVAMSGGVDSTVAALIMARAGADVVGVTLKLRACFDDPNERACCSVDGIGRAVQAAASIGVPHYTVDCVSMFESLVLRRAWDEYDRGRTPSPCLLCNELIKFGFLRGWARDIGAGALVSGHYARISTDGPEPVLLRGTDVSRDQSYFLSRVVPPVGLVFPLGEMTKPRVREIAGAAGLAAAGIRDSQDACWVTPGTCFAEILRQRFCGVARPGRVVDAKGMVIGDHAGIHLYTVGQRHGLCAGGGPRRWVAAIRPSDSAVVTVSDQDELNSCWIVVSDVKAAGGSGVLDMPGMRCAVRHGHEPVDASVRPMDGGRFRVEFARPVRAVAPGQAAAFSIGDAVVGGAWIESTEVSARFECDGHN